MEYLARDRFPWVPALALYAFSFGLCVLFLNAVYWDDWTLVDVQPDVIVEVFRLLGSPFAVTGHLHVALLEIGPPIYRLLTLILMFACGFLLWHIVRRIQDVEPLDRSLVALAFLTAPLYAARVSLIMFPATLCLFLFFLGWYLLVHAPKILSRTIAFTLFVLSFNVPSLLVFFLLPFLHLVLNAWQVRRLSKSEGVTIGIAAILPPAYWLTKAFFFPSLGDFATYQNVNTEQFGADLIGAAVGILYGGVYVLFSDRLKSPRVRAFAMLPMALWLAWLAVIPYRAHKFGSPISMWWELSFDEWWSRHQLLLPLGFAVLVVCIDRVLRPGRVPFIAVFVLLVSSTINAGVTLEYHVDWLKQEQAIQWLATSDEVRRAKTILVDDRARHLNARNRTYRFYEYNGWLKRAYGDETRLAMGRELWPGALSDVPPASFRRYFTPAYNAAQYAPSPPEVVVTIHAAHGRLETLLVGSGLSFQVTALR